MKVLVIQPEQEPEVREINGDLSSLQAVVGGLIEAVYPFDEPVALICNEEGKISGLPWNRCLRDAEGDILDILAGTFFLCGAPPDSEDFVSLTEEQLQRYAARFAVPELILRLGERFLVLPYKREAGSKANGNSGRAEKKEGR